MSPIVQLYALYIESLKKCYFYKEKNIYQNLIFEIGILKGLAEALEIYNVKVKNIEYKSFIKLGKLIIKRLKKCETI